MPKKLLLFFLVCLLLLPVTLLFSPVAKSDELDELNKQIGDLTNALNQSVAATKPLESQLSDMQKQISGIKSQASVIENELVVKKKEIDNGYKSLEEKQDLLHRTVRDFYIRSYYNSPLLAFLSANDAKEVSQALAYQKAAANQDKTIITNIALTINDLEEKSRELKSEQTRLVSLKANLDVQSQKLDSVIAGAKEYQKDVSGKIANLSAKQQEIINARSGGFTFTLGDGGLADEYLSSRDGFNGSAPGGYFAIFSFGAYTHRKGMSQYGAKGRAQAGQSANQILKAYYGKEPVGKDTGGSIKVAGFGDMDFEGRYLMGIAEMPSSWHAEALKAQAIAARTFAYRYKQNGQEICTTEACQVYNNDKANNPPDAWKQAVESTRGQILEDITTYYASTHGGFADPVGWDTTDGSGGSNFIDKSYDKLGGSPWLYKAWWRQGYSTSGATCGRSNPWLSPEEMADIVNAALALRQGGIDTSRITPVTTSCWGGNPYSMSELRSLVSGSLSSATSVSVTQGNGSTNNVTINGISFSGSDFKTAFNLRAPGYLSIPQNGFAFFNIEHK